MTLLKMKRVTILRALTHPLIKIHKPAPRRRLPPTYKDRMGVKRCPPQKKETSPKKGGAQKTGYVLMWNGLPARFISKTHPNWASLREHWREHAINMGKKLADTIQELKNELKRIDGRCVLSDHEDKRPNSSRIDPLKYCLDPKILAANMNLDNDDNDDNDDDDDESDSASFEDD